MSTELYWLSLTLVATALFAFPYVLNRVAKRGLLGTLANPSPDDAPLAPWAERAQRAHANAVENLVIFAPAVLVVHTLNIGNSTTVLACKMYFIFRLVHYIVYTFGVIVLRTVAFFGGWLCIVLLLWRALEVMSL